MKMRASYSDSRGCSSCAASPRRGGGLCRVSAAADLSGCRRSTSVKQKLLISSSCIFILILIIIRVSDLQLLRVEQLLLDLLQPGLPHRLLGHGAHGVLQTRPRQRWRGKGLRSCSCGRKEAELTLQRYRKPSISSILN